LGKTVLGVQLNTFGCLVWS